VIEDEEGIHVLLGRENVRKKRIRRKGKKQISKEK
jgi:hypothetical protein